MIQPPFDVAQLWNLPPDQFLSYAKKMYTWQVEHNIVYQEWVKLMNVQKGDLNNLHHITFLPISFFKTHDIFIGEKPIKHFESSGTTMDIVSKHWVSDLTIYEQSFLHCFDLFYGKPNEYCIIGLLPSYLERSHSSLVYMVDHLIRLSCHAQSGFYLDDFNGLNNVLKSLELQQQKTILIGVSFALMDFVDTYPQQLQHTIVMETGGMKGRKQELTKLALHTYLKRGFGVTKIHSEYGMTELLSQAYSLGNGLFKCPPWMRIMVGDEEDPGVLKTSGRGVLHVIDLANIYSCAFIATQDVGFLHDDGNFEVLGRIDNSDRRGCSLLAI